MIELFLRVYLFVHLPMRYLVCVIHIEHNITVYSAVSLFMFYYALADIQMF